MLYTYFSGATLVLGFLLYGIFNDRKGLKKLSDGDVVGLSILMVVLVLLSWLSVIFLSIYFGMLSLKNKEED